jgi:hypothetical protein
MSKRSVFTTITPLPPVVSRETVMATLRDHLEMIDLNPLVIERHKMDRAPSYASAEEFHAVWYEITDSVTYLPVPGAKSKVTYTGCFNDLPNGLQTHVLAPLGVEIRSRWTLGGNLPGEPAENVEIGLGIPRQGLYLREDCDLRCNIVFSSFVKKTLKKSHETLKARLVQKTEITEVNKSNATLTAVEHWRRSTASGSVVGDSSASQLSYSPSVSGVSPAMQHVNPQGYPPYQQPHGAVPPPLFAGQQGYPAHQQQWYPQQQQQYQQPPQGHHPQAQHVGGAAAELHGEHSQPSKDGPMELPA